MMFHDPQGFSLASSMRDAIGKPSVRTYGLAGLQGLSSVAGVMAQMSESRRAGRNALENAFMTANDEMLNASQAYVSAAGETAGLKRKLADALGARFAAAGGSGVDAGAGVAQANARDMTGRAMASEKITRSNAEIAARRHQINAIQALLKGSNIDASEAASRRNMLRGGILSGLMSIGRMFAPVPGA